MADTTTDPTAPTAPETAPKVLTEEHIVPLKEGIREMIPEFATEQEFIDLWNGIDVSGLDLDGILSQLKEINGEQEESS